MTQNRSTAVMARRIEAPDSLDFFPTPPWATRALVEHVLIGNGDRRDTLAKATAWDPAAGNGDMVLPLAEYFMLVYATDVHDYGRGFSVHDFLFNYRPSIVPKRIDWIITNPPFRLAEEFLLRATTIACTGCALLVRTQFLESLERFRLFRDHPPKIIAQFAERVPMVKGRLDKTASSATSYCWIVWRTDSAMAHQHGTRFLWIPPCRRLLERPGDYDAYKPAAKVEPGTLL